MTCTNLPITAMNRVLAVLLAVVSLAAAGGILRACVRVIAELLSSTFVFWQRTTALPPRLAGQQRLSGQRSTLRLVADLFLWFLRLHRVASTKIAQNARSACCLLFVCFIASQLPVIRYTHLVVVLVSAYVRAREHCQWHCFVLCRRYSTTGRTLCGVRANPAPRNSRCGK